MNKKIIWGIVIAIVVLGGAYAFTKTFLRPQPICWPYCPNMTDQDREKIKQDMLEAQTADWKTYTNIQQGVTVEYPPTWQFEEGRDLKDLNQAWYVSFTDSNQKVKPDTDQPRDRVIFSLAGDSYCKTGEDSGWAIGFADAFYRIKCSGDFTVNMVALNENSKKLEEKVLSTFKLTSVQTTQSSSSQPSITVISPNGGENLNQNDTQKIRWGYKGLNANDEVTIGLRSSGGLVCWYKTTNPITVGLNSFDFVPTNVGRDCIGNISSLKVSESYKVQIGVNKYDTGRGVADISDNYFTFTSPYGTLGQPSITVLSPNGGEVWHRGEQKVINWSQSGFSQLTNQQPSGGSINAPADVITMFINTKPVDSAADVPLYKFIDETNKTSNSYNWTVGNVRNDNIPNGIYYVKVCRMSSYCDWSDSSFTITN